MWGYFDIEFILFLDGVRLGFCCLVCCLLDLVLRFCLCFLCVVSELVCCRLPVYSVWLLLFVVDCVCWLLVGFGLLCLFSVCCVCVS